MPELYVDDSGLSDPELVVVLLITTVVDGSGGAVKGGETGDVSQVDGGLPGGVGVGGYVDAD